LDDNHTPIAAGWWPTAAFEATTCGKTRHGEVRRQFSIVDIGQLGSATFVADSNINS
jgi:hypothetical protein